VVEIDTKGKQKIVKIQCTENFKEEHKLTKTAKLRVKDGDNVKVGDVLFEKAKEEVVAVNSGNVKLKIKC